MNDSKLAGWAAKIAPWLAPVPTAALIAGATVEHLRWPAWVGGVAGVTVELLGLSTIITALDLYAYNRSKRKSDPGAPVGLALALAGVYVVTAISLTVLLDVLPGLTRFAPAIFPLLSLAGMGTLALRIDQDERKAAAERGKAERKAARTERKVGKVLAQVAQGFEERAQGSAEETQGGRRVEDRDLLALYRGNPKMSMAAAGRAIGISRQAVAERLLRLERDGKIHRNGNGVEIRQTGQGGE